MTGALSTGPKKQGDEEAEAAGEGGNAGPPALADAGARLDVGGDGGGAHETGAHGAQPVHHERPGLTREVLGLKEPCGHQEGAC